MSLNDVLMSGQDLANNLLGVLVRFRREAVAVVMDIQKMFYGRGGQSIGPRAGSGSRAAEGFPNVKGCDPSKRATEVYFSKFKKLKK